LRKAIAILLTLSFILISISIIGSIFIFYKKITNNGFEYSIAQDSFIIQSIESKMKKFNIHNENELFKLLLSNFHMKLNGFEIYVSFKSAFDKININKYIINNEVNPSMNFFMDMLCERYNIKECDFLKNLILDSLDDDKYEREDKSEIILYEPFLNGYIYNQRQFQKIINYYKKVTQDKNVDKVPWNRIFSFNAIYTDCNNISPDVAAILNSSPTCISLKNKFSKDFLQKLDIMPFNNKQPYYIWVYIKYIYSSNTHTFKILYDIKNKRIIKVEKYIIY